MAMWVKWLLLTAQVATPAAILIDAAAQDSRLHLDMRYAGSDNFVGEILYARARCYLRPEVASQLRAAQDLLTAVCPGAHLLLKDCYRPLHVQRRMWQVVKNTPHASYVANPAHPGGAVHTFGAAVDVTLCDRGGKEFDMGTPHDFFGPLAQPRHEAALQRQRLLNAGQIRNRRLLRQVMLKGGNFRGIRHEWWHFDALQGSALRRRYARLDISLAALGK